MGAVLREAGLRDTDKAIAKIAKHILGEYKVEDVIKNMNIAQIRAARVSSSSNMIRPSSDNPISRALNAKLTQLGVYPAPDIIGRLHYDLMHGAMFDFDAWVEKLRENKFREIWNLIHPEDGKGPSPIKGGNTKTADTKSAATHLSSSAETAPEQHAKPVTHSPSETGNYSAPVRSDPAPSETQPAGAQLSKPDDPAAESHAKPGTPNSSKAKGDVTENNQSDLPF